MEALRVRYIVEHDGELRITGLPYKKGQPLEMIVLTDVNTPSRPRLTARQLLRSSLIGIWQDREDIQDSSAYARQLREQAQKR